MNIKLPAMYDVSVWDPIADFTKLVPRPLAVAVKATEGSVVVDKTFAGHWAGMAQNNIFRLAYHFNRISASATAQAKLFLDTVTKGGVKPKDIFVLDVEEAGTSAAQIIAWLDVVEARYSNLIMIYSRKNILDPIAMTTAQKTRLKKYPIWTAGYPENPDIYIMPPSFYIPDQTKWGPVWAWQYSERGVVTGIPGNVDLDWMSPALINHFGQAPEPPPPTGDDDMITTEQWTQLVNSINGIKTSIDGIAAKLGGTTPPPVEPPPPATGDGYTGPILGTYKILDLPDMQTGNAITTIQDSYGNEVTVVMDKMVSWMVSNCPGWANFVKNGSVTQGPDGLWRYEVKLIKGQLIRIAEVGGKTKDNPLGNGRIIGVDSESTPDRCAVKMANISPTLTPYYFHKITGQPWYFPIIQPRQQKQMTVPNSWWIPMKWLQKV